MASMKSKKIDQRWLAPGQRNSCQNCKFGEVSYRNPDSAYESRMFKCRVGGFNTVKLAVCDLWEAK